MDARKRGSQSAETPLVVCKPADFVRRPAGHLSAQPRVSRRGLRQASRPGPEQRRRATARPIRRTRSATGGIEALHFDPFAAGAGDHEPDDFVAGLHDVDNRCIGARRPDESGRRGRGVVVGRAERSDVEGLLPVEKRFHGLRGVVASGEPGRAPKDAAGLDGGAEAAVLAGAPAPGVSAAGSRGFTPRERLMAMR